MEPVVGLIAVVLNAVVFAIALVLLVRLGRRHFGEARAMRAAALLALFPFSFVYSMAYSETLTLALILASFLAVERGYAGRAGVFFGLASLTRAQSAFYLMPLLMASRLRGPNRWRWLALGLGPLATLSYIVWVAFFTGSWNGYFGSYAAWGRNVGGSAAGSGSVSEAISGPLAYYFITLMILLIVAVGLFVFARRDQIPLEYIAIPAISLLMLLVSGSLEAVGRVVLLSFPYSWILASRTHPSGGMAGRSVGRLMLACLLGAGVRWLVDPVRRLATWSSTGRPRLFIAWICLDASIAIYLVAYGIGTASRLLLDRRDRAVRIRGDPRRPRRATAGSMRWPPPSWPSIARSSSLSRSGRTRGRRRRPTCIASSRLSC